MNLKYDIYAQSINKYKEQFCGDYYIISDNEDKCRVVVADGIGSGFTANLHATMTAKMIFTLTEKGENPMRVISNAVSSMNRDEQRAADYCAFLMFEADKTGKVNVFNYNMPDPIFMHCGKIVHNKAEITTCGERKLRIINTNLQFGDTIALFSNGVTKAGIGASLTLGIGRKNVGEYLKASYKPKMTSERHASLLLNVCDSLYLHKPGDDITAVVIKTSVSK